MTINDFKDEVIPCTNFNFEFSFLSCIENDSLCDGNQENLVFFSFQMIILQAAIRALLN